MTDVSLQEMTSYTIDPDREVQRTKVLSHVAGADAWRAKVDAQRDFCSLTASEQKDRLYGFAKKICKREQFVFCRFRQLSIFNILDAQHKLILMEEKLQYDYGVGHSGDKEDLKDLREALNAYSKWRPGSRGPGRIAKSSSRRNQSLPTPRTDQAA